MLKASDIARVWSGIDRGSGCWLWKKGIDPQGYGVIVINGKHAKAHRVSWEAAFGEIPRGKCVLHRCDVRHCIRPEHLWVGGRDENNQDRVDKDRSARLHGSLNGMAKLTEPQVVRIRERYAEEDVTLAQLGRDYGVELSTIGKIVTGKNWVRISDSVVVRARRYPRAPRCRLTADQVREIRRRRAAGEQGLALAAEYGCSPSAISLIITRKHWKWLE